jgi:hypothetical protein
MRGESQVRAGLRRPVLPRERWSSWRRTLTRRRAQTKRERLEVIERLLREERQARRVGEVRRHPAQERRWC